MAYQIRIAEWIERRSPDLEVLGSIPAFRCVISQVYLRGLLSVNWWGVGVPKGYVWGGAEEEQPQGAGERRRFSKNLAFGRFFFSQKKNRKRLFLDNFFGFFKGFLREKVFFWFFLGFLRVLGF